MHVILKEDKNCFSERQITKLYTQNGWSAAQKPVALHQALKHSHTTLTAWLGKELVGLANAISDGYLVVYFPHLLVLPAFQNKGIGQQLMECMHAKYKGFHMQMLTSDANTVSFYNKVGFTIAGDTQAMWIYEGEEH